MEQEAILHHLFASFVLVLAGLLSGGAGMSAPVEDAEVDDTAIIEARDCLQRGNPAVAVTLLARLVAENPKQPVAWALLAEAHSALGQEEQADLARANSTGI